MEGTYEYELERAELLGIDPPSREVWEEQEKARKEAALEQEQTEIAAELEAEDEKIKGGMGKMDELNNILSATQLKINKFKVNDFESSFVIVLKRDLILDRLRKFYESVEDSDGKPGSP
jgi:peptidoglycan hydrolase CwlO-like protein